MARFNGIGQGDWHGKGALHTPPQTRRGVMRMGAVGLIALLSACSGIVPGGAPQSGGTVAAVTPGKRIVPNETRHRIALLVPLTGENADIGESLANAARLALIDAQADSILMTSYDTGQGVAAAAQAAIADGNRVILGPLTSDHVITVAGIAQPADVPVISFSNDLGSAGRGVFLMGQLPSQSVDRVVRYSFGQGKRRFAALVPNTVYGQRASSSLIESVRMAGGTLVGIESYERNEASVTAATKRLTAKGAYDALLIGDNGRAAIMAGPIVRKNGGKNAQFLGTELWNTEADLAANTTMRGAWFASVPDTLYGQYAAKYRTRYGKTPFRLSSLGYDAVLLTVKISRSWRLGHPFPVEQMTDRGGFLGVDGPFRFSADGRIERALEVQQVGKGAFTTVDPAPAAFAD